MALRDLLNLVSSVSVIKYVSTPDGKGGVTTTSSTSIIPYAAIYQNGLGNNIFTAGKYAKSGSDTLVYEYGGYSFNVAVSGCTIVEKVLWDGKTYKTSGFCDDVMQLHEVMVQGLEIEK